MSNENFIHTFIQEARDYLEEVEPAFIELKQQCDLTGEIDVESIDSIFRLFHSMKGTSGFLQLDNITRITHQAENLLDLFRKRKATLSSEHTELIFRILDFLHHVLDHVEEHQNDKGFDQAVNSLLQEIDEFITAAPLSIAPGSSSSTGVQSQGIENLEVKIDDFPEQDSTYSEGAEVFTEDDFDLPEIEITAEIKDRFAHEGEELLDSAEQALLRTDSSTDPYEHIYEGFRNIHSFKGNCGFMGFKNLGEFSHKLEAILEKMLEGSVPCSRENIQTILELLDALKTALAELAGGGKDHVDSAAFALLDAFDNETPSSERSKRGSSIIIVGSPEFTKNIHSAINHLNYSTILFHSVAEAKDENLLQGEEPAAILLEVTTEDTQAIKWIIEIKNDHIALPVLTFIDGDNSEIEKTLRALQVDAVTPLPIDSTNLPYLIQAAIERHDALEVSIPQEIETQRKSVDRKDIRVDLEKLDSLIDLVGELVIAESMVTKNPDLEGLELESFDRAAHHLRRLTANLQDIALSVRMIPVAATFRKMIRLVHDISNKVGKQIQLELSGEDTEVDKTIIELIADPLVHLIRNSCDHGIGLPEERKAIGKPEIGHILLEARHVGGEVWIIIQDDGRGLHRDQIIKKAIARGIIQDNGAELREDQVFQLIFEPGFSTAEQVTDISGRGVGMDVVKKNLAKLKGRIDVQSKEGQGTTMILRIPLTLAIIEGMLVRVGKNNYTIPMLSIRESLRPTNSQLIYTPDGQELLKLREEIIPILRLHKLYNREPDVINLNEGILVVVEDNKRPLAVFVDEIVGQQKTVIKGLSSFFGEAKGISGCTILGSGQVSLILDVGNLVDASLDREWEFEHMTISEDVNIEIHTEA